MRVLWAAALICLLVAPARAVSFVRSAPATLGTTLRQDEPTDPHDQDYTVLWSADDPADAVPVLRFTVPSLLAGETIDSVHVIVHNAGGALGVSQYRCYRVIRVGVTAAATWETYDGSGSWGTAGAWGAGDIDLTTDHGYGANGIMWQAINEQTPDSTMIARGAGFSAYIAAHTGAALTLAWHDTGTDAAGSWTALGLADPDLPHLRIYGRRTSPTGGRRRGLMSLPTGR